MSNPGIVPWKFEGGDCASREELADYYHTMRMEYEVRLQGNKSFSDENSGIISQLDPFRGRTDRKSIILMHLRDGRNSSESGN